MIHVNPRTIPRSNSETFSDNAFSLLINMVILFCKGCNKMLEEKLHKRKIRVKTVWRKKFNASFVENFIVKNGYQNINLRKKIIIEH